MKNIACIIMAVLVFVLIFDALITGNEVNMFIATGLSVCVIAYLSAPVARS